MNEEREDFAAKLLLIESEAELLLRELPPGVPRDRLQRVAITAKLLRERLGVVVGESVPAPKPKGS
jgi:hypothetical protein